MDSYSRDIPTSHPLNRFFRGLTEFTFQTELGIADPDLLGYLADLLVRFSHSSNLTALRDVQGRPMTDLVAILDQAQEDEDEDRQRTVHQHVGDVTLFWTGVFPEAVPYLQKKRQVDPWVGLQSQGKRSYYLASTFQSDQAVVLRQLSTEFELYAFGLSRVREEWERVEEENRDLPGSSPPIIC